MFNLEEMVASALILLVILLLILYDKCDKNGKIIMLSIAVLFVAAFVIIGISILI